MADCFLLARSYRDRWFNVLYDLKSNVVALITYNYPCITGTLNLFLCSDPFAMSDRSQSTNQPANAAHTISFSRSRKLIKSLKLARKSLLILNYIKRERTYRSEESLTFQQKCDKKMSTGRLLSKSGVANQHVVVVVVKLKSSSQMPVRS